MGVGVVCTGISGAGQRLRDIHDVARGYARFICFPMPLPRCTSIQGVFSLLKLIIEHRLAFLPCLQVAPASFVVWGNMALQQAEIPCSTLLSLCLDTSC